MYCKKCGKPTVGNEEICQDCKAATATTTAEKDEILVNDPNQPNATMISFGKGLASTIMGFGVFIVSNVLESRGKYMNLVSMILLSIIDVAVIALSIVFGAMAIHKYGSFKSNSTKKPLPAFIMGLIGVVLAGISAVIVLVFLFVDVPEMASIPKYY
ncbi:MAG: hypothetical protein K2M64_02855 [Clostridia bacterium]|nr:hypothetical protein [Clostridia bacterium]